VKFSLNQRDGFLRVALCGLVVAQCAETHDDSIESAELSRYGAHERLVMVQASSVKPSRKYCGAAPEANIVSNSYGFRFIARSKIQ